MQQRLFDDIPEPPSEGRSIAQAAQDACSLALHGVTPITETAGSFHFLVSGFDGQQYAVSVARVADLVGENRH